MMWGSLERIRSAWRARRQLRRAIRSRKGADARAGPINAGGGPQPAAVRGNDWRQVQLPEGGSFTPTLPVSVIVPCFEAPGALTLAGLERQDYPLELFEVVIVVDGSEPPLRPPAGTPLDVRVVRQERRGFGLARARNAGARAAAHGILVFLDGDVIPEAGLLAAHARWHHAVSDALTLGFCAYVQAAGIDAEAVRGRAGSLRALFADRPADPPWLERHMARTADLTSAHEDLFRAVTGHNLGIGKAFYREVGGFDESFRRCGGEDTEFGYRVQTRGGLLAPVREAFAWHQGRLADGREGKARDQHLQRAKLGHCIADPGFRRSAPGRIFTVPRHVVTVEAGDVPAARVVAAVEGLLADPAGDLAVRVETPVARADLGPTWLEAHFGADARVRVAPEGPARASARASARVSALEVAHEAALEAFPASPFHIRLGARATVPGGLVGRLHTGLGDAVVATARLAGGSRVSIARAWALHRARRTGLPVAAFGDARRLKAAAVRPRPVRGAVLLHLPRSARANPDPPPRRGALRANAARVWAEARDIRGIRTAWRFLAWLAVALRWRLGQARAAVAAPSRAAAMSSARPTPPPGPTHWDPPLGTRIAVLGPRARAVFRASSRVTHGLDAGPVDVVLADTADTEGAAAGIGVPTVRLDAVPALAVPAFDPAAHNPVGCWVREVEPRAACVGPRRQLPAGVRAREVPLAERSRLVRYHHVEDVGAFHDGAAERAGTLVRIAACGVPVHLADHDPALETLLGPELHGLMSAPIGYDGAEAREVLSIRMRRAALRGHSLGARARQLCEAARVDPPESPLVSVLLATRRPGRLAAAVANVARQDYPRLELVLALHGPGFEADAVACATASLAAPVTVLRLGEDHPLGTVLNAASTAAAGPLLSKMDDDDVYGVEHLWDLVLAREYSGAALVGKFPSTVYLAHRDRTVRRRRVRSETWSQSLGGSAMLITRADLGRVGGWRPARRHVDAALIEDVVRGGGGVYRTHDAGYVVVRHAEGHTWKAADAAFLAEAESVWPGWRPALAGIEGVPSPLSDPAMRGMSGAGTAG
ncbi:glycosyltransferase [Candidatus Palauibacter sp.]|uniref:glycosyltransferase n=1 Tax=Candidatus Palauibacter sp. TaxID=3101350 RepID=UPI003B013E28